MAKFDLEKTGVLYKLFEIAKENREHHWRQAFLEAVLDASLVTDEKQIRIGPDGFPYFTLRLPPVGQEITPFCISHILDTCLDKGFGIAINPSENSADWIFSYGDLWNLKITGDLNKNVADIDSNANKKSLQEVLVDLPQATLEVVTPTEHKEVLVASPAESFLPQFARNAIKTFLARLAPYKEGRKPQCFLLIDFDMQPVRNLVFNFFAEEFEPEGYAYLMHLLSWNFPSHVGLLGIQKDSDLVSNFHSF